MPRIVYVNGRYLPEHQATISIFDRGFLFADAVYEVSAVLNNRLIENRNHLRRLHRSLDELAMDSPLTDPEIVAVQEELIRRNELREGVVYLQISRGAADRDFVFPTGAQPTMVAFTQVKPLLSSPQAEEGISVITTPDIRWGRPDIKTVGLLASSMAKMQALQAGADDALLVDSEGYITEGSACNAYIVTTDNTIVTRHLSQAILPGITRSSILELAREAGLSIEERPFSVSEALAAREAFVTGSAAFVLPVVKIDNRQLNRGRPGPLTTRLRKLYTERALREAGERD
ncbi:D-amino-acid transaminase [Desulfogranum mediterraneum]|uniref:D-amino-acid transaminase n=1 Tax=Desulfogranum mediterraneum TaxID=160661 RepID=UPI00042A198D|nr:D-amino-acid transaminase [Desulfogranum mediterraneum]